MAGRRRRERELDQLIQGLIGLGLLGSFFPGLSATGTLIGAFIFAGCAFGLIFAVLFLIKVQKEERLKRSGIRDIDQMDGIQFERCLRLLFESQGYKVEVTREIGDCGADLVLKKDGKTSWNRQSFIAITSAWTPFRKSSPRRLVTMRMKRGGNQPLLCGTGGEFGPVQRSAADRSRKADLNDSGNGSGRGFQSAEGHGTD